MSNKHIFIFTLRLCYLWVFSLFLQFFYLFKLDYSKGFGGKFGVQNDRQDKSAAGWDHVEQVEKHESQKGNILSCIFS